MLHARIKTAGQQRKSEIYRQFFVASLENASSSSSRKGRGREAGQDVAESINLFVPLLMLGEEGRKEEEHLQQERNPVKRKGIE